MICLNNETNAIGCIDLFAYNPTSKKAGIGILIGEKTLRNKGYARQALCLLIQYIFSKPSILTIFAEVSEDNNPSIHLFESCSFSYIKTTFKDGKPLRYYELNQPNCA